MMLVDPDLVAGGMARATLTDARAARFEQRCQTTLGVPAAQITTLCLAVRGRRPRLRWQPRVATTHQHSLPEACHPPMQQSRAAAFDSWATCWSARPGGLRP
jgi:hypothetical protein